MPVRRGPSEIVKDDRVIEFVLLGATTASPHHKFDRPFEIIVRSNVALRGDERATNYTAVICEPNADDSLIIVVSFSIWLLEPDRPTFEALPQ